MRKQRHDRARRVCDVLFATGALLLAAPLMLAVAASIACTLGRPVLYRQYRPGLYGMPFRLVKFRTMRESGRRPRLVSDAARLTHLGAWLRATSLDELPTLWNVLRGQMSVVGPRPLLMRYLTRYTPEQMRRHEVRPGITGLAQVRGRNALSWDEKFALDVWYVDHRSLALDARILAETVLAVLRRTGITAPGEATAPEFVGSVGVR